MATAQTIIDRALRLIGAIASGASPTVAETSDGLIALNALIESWQTEQAMFYTMTETAYTVSASDGSYTVGPSGNFNLAPRPIKLENIFARKTSIDYPIEIVGFDRWDAIPDKTTESDLPSMAYYEPAVTTGVLQVWPVPSASFSLRIVTGTAFTVLAAAGTTVTGPQGYERALAYNLAMEIAPEYPGHPDLSAVAAIAKESRANIMRANKRPMKAYTELGQMFHYRSDIYSGGTLG